VADLEEYAIEDTKYEKVEVQLIMQQCIRDLTVNFNTIKQCTAGLFTI